MGKSQSVDKSPLVKKVQKESHGIILIGIKLAFARMLMSQRRYNHYLNKQIKTISDDSFPLYATQLIDCIKLTKKTSSNYKNIKSEVDAILQQFQRFKPYYREVMVAVKVHRQKYNLNI